jgi:hypothetical protein
VGAVDEVLHEALEYALEDFLGELKAVDVDGLGVVQLTSSPS